MPNWALERSMAHWVLVLVDVMRRRAWEVVGKLLWWRPVGLMIVV